LIETDEDFGLIVSGSKTINQKTPLYKSKYTHPEKVGFFMSNPNWKCETLTNNKSAKNRDSSSIEQKVKERTIYNRTYN
jgi:hypothetical protein